MKWKKTVKRLLFPHLAFVLLCSLISASGMIYASTARDSRQPVCIAVYALSFYTLVLLCLRLPQLSALVRRFRRENVHYLRYASDVQFRMCISLNISFVWNAIYALFQLMLGFCHRSIWFYAMAAYYALLALMRLILKRSMAVCTPGKNLPMEWQRYRLCGMGLVPIHLVLSVFILYFVRHLRIVQHHEITVIAMAAYTFASLALAIYNVFHYRRYKSPLCSAAKALSLASASVSMLSLENTMIFTFSQGGHGRDQQILLGLSGAAVSVFILSMAIYMIVRAHQNINGVRNYE